MSQKYLIKFYRFCIQSKLIKKSIYLLVKVYFVIIGNLLFAFSKRYASLHTSLFRLQEWKFSSKKPSHYEHEINLYNWIYKPSSVQFAEAGILARLLIKKNNNVLDLCSGDGIYPYLFYSDCECSIDAIDINQKNIHNSKKKYKSSNLNYIHGNVLNYDFGKERYDVVIIIEAIAYFSKKEQTDLFAIISKAMKKNGVLYLRSPLEERKHYGANQKEVITNKDAFEKQLGLFWNIEFDQITNYKNRNYLNYYLKKNLI
jgi:ubiquinone/menaquinone biosynthesis C-methylase UbiE